MKNDLSLPVLWIAVGSLVLATVVMVNNYQPRVPTQQMTFNAADGSNNTAIVSGIRRDCAAIVAPLDSLCETMSGQEKWCCTLMGSMIYAHCMGSSMEPWDQMWADSKCSF